MGFHRIRCDWTTKPPSLLVRCLADKTSSGCLLPPLLLNPAPPAPLPHSELGSVPWWVLPLSPPPLLSQSAQAAVTKCHRLKSLNNVCLFSLRSQGRKSKIRVLTWLDGGYSFLSGWQMATFWLCSDIAEREGGRERAAVSLPLLQFSSVTQSCLTLCDPMNCSTPGLPVHHQLPELTQTHVHWVSDAIQPSHSLSFPSPPAFNLPQHQGLFQWKELFQFPKVFSVLRIRWPKYWSFSFRISPSNEYSGLISFKMDWLDLLAVQGTLKSLLQHGEDSNSSSPPYKGTSLSIEHMM